MLTMEHIKILLLIYFLTEVESRHKNAAPSISYNSETNNKQGGFSSVIYHQSGSPADSASSFSEININYSDSDQNIANKHKESSIFRENDLKELQKKLREHEHHRLEQQRYKQQEKVKNNIHVPRFPSDDDSRVSIPKIKQNQGLQQVHPPNLGESDNDFDGKQSPTESPYLSLLQQSVRNYKNRLIQQTHHGNQNEYSHFENQNKPRGPRINQADKNRYLANYEDIHSMESYESFKDGLSSNQQRNRYNSDKINHNKNHGQDSITNFPHFHHPTTNNKGNQRNKYIIHGDNSEIEHKKIKNHHKGWSEEIIPSGRLKNQEHSNSKPLLNIKSHFDQLNLLNEKDTDDMMSSMFNPGNIRPTNKPRPEHDLINIKENSKSNTLKTASSNNYNRPIVLPVKEFPGLGLSIDGDVVKLVPMPGSGIKLRPTYNNDHSSYLDLDSNKQVTESSTQKPKLQNNEFSFQEVKIDTKKPNIQSVISQEPIKTYINPVKVLPQKINLNLNESLKPKIPLLRSPEAESPLGHVQYHVNNLNKLKVKNVNNDESNGFQPLPYVQQNKFPHEEKDFFKNHKNIPKYHLEENQHPTTPRPAHLTNHKLVLPKPVFPTKINRPNFDELIDYETNNKNPKIKEQNPLKPSLINNPFSYEENNDSKESNDYETSEENNAFQPVHFVMKHNSNKNHHEIENLDVPIALKLKATSPIKSQTPQKTEFSIQKQIVKDLSAKPSLGYENFQTQAYTMSNLENNLNQQTIKTNTNNKGHQSFVYPSIINKPIKNEDKPIGQTNSYNSPNDKTMEQLLEAIALHKSKQQKQNFEESNFKKPHTIPITNINSPQLIHPIIELNKNPAIIQKEKEESHELPFDSSKLKYLLEQLKLKNQKIKIQNQQELYELQNEDKLYPLKINRPEETDESIKTILGGHLKNYPHTNRPVNGKTESYTKSIQRPVIENIHEINLKELLESMKIDPEPINYRQEASDSQIISIQNLLNQQKLNKQQEIKIPLRSDVKHRNTDNVNKNNNPSILKNNMNLFLNQIQNPEVISNWPPKGTMEAIKSSMNQMTLDSKLLEQPEVLTMPINMQVKKPIQHLQKEDNKNILKLIEQINNQKLQNYPPTHQKQSEPQQRKQVSQSMNSNENIMNPDLTKLLSSIVPQATHQYKGGKHIITGPEEKGVFYRIIVEDPYAKNKKTLLINHKLDTIDELDEEELEEVNEKTIMRKNDNINDESVNHNKKLIINQNFMKTKINSNYNPPMINKTIKNLENKSMVRNPNENLKLILKDHRERIKSEQQSATREYTTTVKPKLPKPLAKLEENSDTQQIPGKFITKLQKLNPEPILPNNNYLPHHQQIESNSKIINNNLDTVAVKTVTTQYLQQQAQLQQQLLEKQKQKQLLRLQQEQEEEKQKHLQEFHLRQQRLQLMEIEKKKQLQLQQEQETFNKQRYQNNDGETLRKGHVASDNDSSNSGGAFSVSASYTIDSKSKH